MARESVQKKIGRVRAPRVHITYDVETGGAIEKQDVPFVAGVFADLSGMPAQPLPPLSQRKFAEVDRDNINQVLREAAPRIVCTLQNFLDPGGPNLLVELNFESMSDFAPDRVARQVGGLRNLLDLRIGLSNLRSMLIGNDRLEKLIEEFVGHPELLNLVRVKGFNRAVNPHSAAGEEVEGRTLLGRIVESALMGRNDEQTEDIIRWLESFFDEVATGRITLSNDVDQAISHRITALDELLSRQLDEVMHAEPMQKLEASWRGLDYLVQQSETSSSLKIKVFNASKPELIADFSNVASFDQAALFRTVWDEQYRFAGADPFGVLIGDYEFGHDPRDIDLLEKLSGVAAWSNAPFIAAAAPALFRFESFTELGGPRDLGKIFEDPAYLKWNTFRKNETSRYIGLCLPHVLMRLPYGRDKNVLEEFDYEEAASEQGRSHFLWGNPAYIFAGRLTYAFSRYGWCASIRGIEGGGLVEGLPIDTFQTDEGDVVLKCPTEIAITDRREWELASLGFIPLCYYKGTDVVLFMGAASLKKPQPYLDDEANANSRLSTQLPYIFACTRFAHVMKKAVRNSNRAWTCDECETFLNEWISRYVLVDDVASQETRAKFPLREGLVRVVEDPGKAGAYSAIVFLRPQFQLDEIAVSLRLVVPLPVARTEAASPGPGEA